MRGKYLGGFQISSPNFGRGLDSAYVYGIADEPHTAICLTFLVLTLDSGPFWTASGRYPASCEYITDSQLWVRFPWPAPETSLTRSNQLRDGHKDCSSASLRHLDENAFIRQVAPVTVRVIVRERGTMASETVILICCFALILLFAEGCCGVALVPFSPS